MLIKNNFAPLSDVHQKAASRNVHSRLSCVFQCDRAAFFLFYFIKFTFLQRSQGDVTYLFPAPLNRCIIYEVKYPENLVEMLVGC